jgi:hypothetical protein
MTTDGRYGKQTRSWLFSINRRHTPTTEATPSDTTPTTAITPAIKLHAVGTNRYRNVQLVFEISYIFREICISFAYLEGETL